MITDEGRELQERIEQARRARETGACAGEHQYMETEPQPVVITDIKMSFVSMIEFMVKWTLASIPAMIILFLIGCLLVLVVLPMFGLIGTRSH
jgi:hypothetical protein